MDRASVLKGAALGVLLCFVGGEWQRPLVEPLRIHLLDADFSDLVSRLSHVHFIDSVVGAGCDRVQSLAAPADIGLFDRMRGLQ